ncbi:MULTISPECIES: ABC transporter ATP-binding protein [unclassified Gordonia (in: high G+C Gram-positive bacteria)]
MTNPAPRTNALRTLLTLLLDGSKPAVRTFSVLAVISVIVRAVGVVLLVPLIAALVDGRHGAALGWLGGLTLATLLGWAVDWAASRVSFDLGFSLLNGGQHTVAERLSRVRLTWFTAGNTATARQAIAATGPDLVGVVVYLVVPLLSAILLPIAIAVALLGISWQLALVALAGVPVMLVALWGSAAMSRRADEAVDAANVDLTERVIEFGRTQPALRVARRVGTERGLAEAAISHQHAATLRLLTLQVPGQVLFSVVSQLVLFALAVTTVWLTVSDRLSVAEAVALIVVAVRYIEPLTSLAELGAGLEATRLTLRRIGAVLAAPAVGDGVAALPDGPRAPRIEFENVGFQYGDPDRPVLTDLSLVVEPGTTTAVIGPSGSGKSTILALIAGLQEPTAGRILIDGVDASTLDLHTRRALTSVVFQEPYLFDGTIEENILAGDPAASPQRASAAATSARVDEITARVPGGLGARVGEGGSALSGGERQRVSIARALLKPAPVLLIDEATSALDNENERAIVDALSDTDDALTPERRERTRIIVAHRRPGIRRADHVLVLDDGRVVESGSPDELLAAGGRFAQFWAQQEAGAAWKLTDAAATPA